MPEPLVIINTSLLFYLHQIDLLSLLQALYSQVTVPIAVQRELQAGEAKGLSTPNLEQISWMAIASANSKFLPNVTDLGEGEAEVIAIGIENPGSLLVLDDAPGRRIAQLHNLAYTGTLGVIIRAKEMGYLDRVRPVIQLLQDHGMWIGQPVIETILRQAGELS
jgi:uncharacterized protein